MEKIKNYLSLKMIVINESNIYINVIIIYVNILNLGWVKIKEIYLCWLKNCVKADSVLGPSCAMALPDLININVG